MIALKNNYTENSMDIYWEGIADKICSSFSFSDIERLKFLKNKVAKLIGCLPKIAETQTPERDGCSNLAVYIMSTCTTKQFYIHQQCDDADVFSRLHDIMNFNEGNKDIIRKGMSLLSLMMINDYKRDEVEDRDTQKYNPFNSNSWNFDELRNRLLEDYEKTESNSIDSILNLSESATLLWQPN